MWRVSVLQGEQRIMITKERRFNNMRNNKGYKMAFFRNGVIISCKNTNDLKRACKRSSKIEKCEYRFTIPSKEWFNI